MGDAAGEGADALQPLRAQELLLELAVLGDVGIDREDIAWLADGIQQQGPASFHDDLAAIAGDLSQLAEPLAGL